MKYLSLICRTVWLASTGMMLVGECLAANIVLRETSNHRGTVVYLGDVADISAANASELHELLTTPLMAAPPRGSQEFLSQSRVGELLASRGVEIENHVFSGATLVTIGKAPRLVEEPAASPIPAISADEVEQAVLDAVLAHLATETGFQDWRIELKLTTTDLKKLSSMELPFVARGGKSPWSGWQRLTIGSAGSVESLAISIRIVRLTNLVVALRPLGRGELVGTSDVELRQEVEDPTLKAISSLEEVIGKEVLRPIAEGAIIQSQQLRSPLEVRRGETVKVVARTGGIQVTTYAVVRQDGSRGDLVQVETLERKERFNARVSGWKELEVLPTGANTEDYNRVSRRATTAR